jgi:hypothetical protein
MHAVKQYNRDRQTQELEPLRIVSAYNTGPMMVGLVGVDDESRATRFPTP